MASTSKPSLAKITIAATSEHEVLVNFGNSCQDNRPVPKIITIADLVQKFSIPETNRGKLLLADYLDLDKKIPAQKLLRDAEKNGSYFIMTSFKNDGKRNGVNIDYVTAFVGDIDTGTISKADLQAILQGYVYIAYSSYSHSSGMPKWRFILFYEDCVTVATHLKVFNHLQNRFNGQLDNKCQSAAQLWYTPACPPDAGGIFEFFTGDGEFFDPDTLPQLTPASPPKLDLVTSSPGTAPMAAAEPPKAVPVTEEQRLSEALPFINADERDTWVKVGMAIKGKFGDAGLTIWKEWSKTSPKYEEVDADATWDSLLPRTEGGITLGTVFHLAAQAGYISQIYQPSPAPASLALSSPLLKPLFDIKDAKVDRFVRNPAPQRRWLLHNTLPLGKVGMLVAPGGTGKSFLMIQLAVAVATNTRLADRWQVDSPGSSLILCAEEDDDDLHHRLRDVLAATTAHTPATQQLIEKHVHIKSMLIIDNLMTRANARGEIVMTDYVDRLALAANQIPDLKLIIIDPASRFRGGNENAAQDTTRFAEALERLRTATGATVLLVHHTNKGSMNADEVNQGASRGSSALTDAVRWQMSLSKPTTKHATAAGISTHNLHQYVLATITKNNSAPPQDPVLMKRGPGGALSAVLLAAPRMSHEVALIGLLDSERAAKRTYTANSLEKCFSGSNGVLKLSAAALRLLIASCVQAGYIRKRTSKPVNELELTGKMPP